jgi:uncharacterized cupin superfamily protein
MESDVSNVFEPEFDADQDREGFRWRRAKVAAAAGAERLGASLYELPPGQAPFPLHYHLGNEELLIVLRGEPSLRTGEDERELAEGEVVAFPVGERGAHQVVNRTEEPVRILIVSEMNAPDVVIRPEAGNLSAAGRPPGGAGEGIHKVFRIDDEVSIWEGVDPPPPRR